MRCPMAQCDRVYGAKPWQARALHVGAATLLVEPMKHQPKEGYGNPEIVDKWCHFYEDGNRNRGAWSVPGPPWRSGLFLRVRETWGTVHGNGVRIVYRADGPVICSGTGRTIQMQWGSSTGMPRHIAGKATSRTTLEVVDVAARRIQDIAEEEARATGCQSFFARFPDVDRGKRLATGECVSDFPYRAALATHWDEGAKGRFLWRANPWVWMVTVRRWGV